MASTEREVVLESVVVISSEEQGERNHRGTPNTAAPFHQLTAEQPAQSWIQRHRSRIFGNISKVAAIASLLLTAIMAWPAVTSAGDTRMATLLAEWTSQKEYMEFCEDHDWESDSCAQWKNAELPPPPTKLTLLRRYVEGYSSCPGGLTCGSLGGHGFRPILAHPSDRYTPVYPPLSAQEGILVRPVYLASSIAACSVGLMLAIYALHRRNSTSSSKGHFEESYSALHHRSRARVARTFTFSSIAEFLGMVAPDRFDSAYPLGDAYAFPKIPRETRGNPQRSYDQRHEDENSSAIRVRQSVDDAMGLSEDAYKERTEEMPSPAEETFTTTTGIELAAEASPTNRRPLRNQGSRGSIRKLFPKSESDDTSVGYWSTLLRRSIAGRPRSQSVIRLFLDSNVPIFFPGNMAWRNDSPRLRLFKDRNEPIVFFPGRRNDSPRLRPYNDMSMTRRH